MKNQFLSFHLDFLGFATSVLCAVHCAVLPFSLSIIPLAGFQFLKNPLLEFSLICLSFMVAYVALLRGFNRHFKKSPLVIVSSGFLLIFLGHFYESSWFGILILILGAMLIAFAHYQNWKHLKVCSAYHLDLMINKGSNQSEDKDKKAA